MPLKPGNWCYQCGAEDVEKAREGCKNPSWHIPNANAPRDQEDEAKQGVRLPYAEN